jgi:hypothetical protein
MVELIDLVPELYTSPMFHDFTCRYFDDIAAERSTAAISSSGHTLWPRRPVIKIVVVVNQCEDS